MIPGMNPKMMQQAMKKMGIKQEEIDASEVIIKCPTKDIVIKNPQVSRVEMMGQETWQVIGEAEEREPGAEIKKEDVHLVAEQANVSLKEAEQALHDAHGDIAAAIVALHDR